IFREVYITNSTNYTLTYCLSPNNPLLLNNHVFMITRSMIRFFIYYVLPLIFVATFYILIAKHLFKTKTIVLHQPSTSNIKGDRVNNCKTNGKMVMYSRILRNSNSNKNNSNDFTSIQTLGYTTARSSTLDMDESIIRSSTTSRCQLLSTTHRYPVTCNSSNENSPRIQSLHNDGRTRKQMRARHKVAKTVLFLSIIFFICWLPKQIHDLYWYIGVIIYHSKWNYFWHINKTTALLLSYIYSCINPFALYFLSSTFRHFYNRYLFFWTNISCMHNCCYKNEDKIDTIIIGNSIIDDRPRSNTASILDLKMNKKLNNKNGKNQHSKMKQKYYMRSDTILTASLSLLTQPQNSIISNIR
ncbi:unnamed protein product, partial [Didymodactylos carnosus]